MLDDNLNGVKLAKMVRDARFDSPEDFQDELEEPLQKNFIINEERTDVVPHTAEKRVDMVILDAMTQREALIVFGFKTVKDSPELDELDFQNFHQACKKQKALYGVLLTETESHFFDYTGTQPVEIKEIRPLNHIDAEFERNLTPQKIKDWLTARKYWVGGFALLTILMLSISMANARQCKLYGPVKGEVRSTGEKVYFLPESSGYDNRTTGDQKGERRFCTTDEAEDDGFLPAE